MDFSNTDYINISVFLICVMMSVVFFLAWKKIEQKTHTLMWSIVFQLTAINGLVNAFNDLFPNRDIYWVIVNALSLTIQWFALAGFMIRAKKNPYQKSIIGYFILVELLIVWFTIFSPHMGLRMMFAPLSGTLIMFACCYAILSPDKRKSAAEYATVILLFINGLINFASALTALMQGAERNAEYLSLYLHINFIFMPASLTGLGLFTILILADDLSSRLRLQARTDQLTGLLNRRGFFYKSNRRMEKSQTENEPMSAIITDIDFFKKINDSYGHVIGDKVLRVVARRIDNFRSKFDVTARMGGEEFVILLYGKNKNDAMSLAEKIREYVQSPIEIDGSIQVNLTMSFGLSDLKSNDNSLVKMLKKADDALYKAKADGRDCVRAL